MPAVIGAHGRVALDHAQRHPSAFLSDGFEVNARHDALAGPVVPPIVDVEIADPGAAAGRCVCLLDRAAAGHFVVSRIAIRAAAVRQEDRP